MTRHDPEDLRAFAQRAWGRLERLQRAERVRRPVEEKVRIAEALFAAAQELRPGWPDDVTRRQDLAHHQHMCRLLRRAAHVGAR
ncbi:MAG: hypothetical protein ABIO70_31810 [Pseudomonadota bacterium]